MALFSAAALVVAAASPSAQTLDEDRARGRRMLRDIRDELRVRYYDPTFGGRDLDELLAPSGQGIDQARSQAEISGLLAQAVMTLDDSHTYFIPSPLSYEVDYGFLMQVIGDRCFVTAVKPGSLADQDGLKPGMALAAVEGAAAIRRDMWKIDYALNVIRPRRELRLHLQAPGEPVQVKVVRATTTEARQYERFEEWAGALEGKLRSRGASPYGTFVVDGTVLIAKLNTFNVSEKQIDEMMKRAAGKQGLVLDLRRNGGGAVSALVRLAGYLFDGRRTIGALQRRKNTERLVTDARKAEQRFTGKMVVLVDSLSASAAEVLARALQLEQRAVVVGDRTAGAVMVSMPYHYMDGHEGRFLIYGLSITDAKLLMNDGASLEGTGVTPDEVLLPTADDLVSGRDPVLARATQMLGAPLTPERAGALFKREWK